MPPDFAGEAGFALRFNTCTWNGLSSVENFLLLNILYQEYNCYIWETINKYAMDLNDYKLVLLTCASSENEVTGKYIKLENTFECDLKGVNLESGLRLTFSNEHDEYPDFSFTVLEVKENSLLLKRKFVYSSNEYQVEIGPDNPECRDCFDFGRYTYEFRLKLVKR